MCQLSHDFWRVSLCHLQLMDVYGTWRVFILGFVPLCFVQTSSSHYFIFHRFSFLIIRSRKSHFIARNVAFVELVALKPFAIAMNVACASPWVSLTRISASATNTRTIVQFVAKTCFPVVNRHKICLVDTRFTPIAFENSPVLIIAVPFAKRRSCPNKVWPQRGKLEPETLPSIPCLPICSGLWILCAMIVKPKVMGVSGISWEFSARDAILLIRSSSKS